MERTGAWGPCQIQLANWTSEEQPPATSSLLMEYASIDIPCTLGLQAYVPQSCVTKHQHQQLVEHYEGATQHELMIEEGEEQEAFQVALHRMEMEMHHYTPPYRVFQEAVRGFEDGIGDMKMHRYPSDIRDLGDWYTPRIVALGPYHHDRQELKLEEVKYVAAYHWIRGSDHSLQEEVDRAVVKAVHDARHLYNKDVMAGIGDGDFLHMMFFDACFLVQFMFYQTGSGEKEMDWSLRRFFSSNRKVLRNDVMLLENQLPWGVVKAVMRVRHVNLTRFISYMRVLLKNRGDYKEKDVVLDDDYEPPHLLGLVRHHIVESREISKKPPNINGVSFSVSPIKLAEIGIKLRPNETTEVISMGLSDEGKFSALLSSMSLTHACSIFLLNMAALELCTSHQNAEDSAVCSYLHLFSMLVHRDEDVQELRTRGILEGAGLTNKEALDFFTRFQSVALPLQSYGLEVLFKIENYKVCKPKWIKFHAFLHKNKSTIYTVFSVTVAVLGIIGTLVGILLQI